MSYVRTHPFGYVPKKDKKVRDHRREQVQYVQTVHMKNGQVRTIKHYTPKQRKSKTFAEMVYENVF